ncbi:MAG TPA: sigma-70 family RNA polymerase sigma factor [Candidatus Ventrousia excrementavium]|uniref:Sigma-70 family RNA polymerase sigma factor n=1 Tax=Candidatus Ventrousia excrementavium TaxID=2840961 RepID=A0A9D1IVB3_9CLOT|nr:sigma-70 family RNA polymerase sigma factor [Candidatus Ventrousia excrementavium]
MTRSEQDIVRRARAGDERAFEELVTTYEKKIYHISLRYTGNEHDAMDVTQEVFLRVFRFLPQFQEESRFSTWLYRIAVNASLDFLRRRSPAGELSLDDPDEEGLTLEVSDPRYQPEAQLESAELRQAICDGIEALPPRMREIVILRDISGLSYEEIGEVLGIEQGTVKSRLSRARSRLATFLTGKGNHSRKSASKEQLEVARNE